MTIIINSDNKNKNTKIPSNLLYNFLFIYVSYLAGFRTRLIILQKKSFF